MCYHTNGTLLKVYDHSMTTKKNIPPHPKELHYKPVYRRFVKKSMPQSRANSSASKAECNIPNLHPALHSKICSPEGGKAVIARPPAEEPSPLLAPSTESLNYGLLALPGLSLPSLGKTNPAANLKLHSQRDPLNCYNVWDPIRQNENCLT